MIDPGNQIGAAIQRGIITELEAAELRQQLRNDLLAHGNYQITCTLDSIKRITPDEWITITQC